MGSIFLLEEGDRTNILQQIMQFFGCTYICLWQYLPHPSNCLFFLDGICGGLGNVRPSSSSSFGGSRAQRLFDQYKQAVFINIIEGNGVPGLAFRNQNNFMKLNLVELQSVASIEVQMKFYQEAGVKMSVFMGCNSGEMEFGFPNNDTPVDLEMMMKKWFPEDFPRLAMGGLPRQPSSKQTASIPRNHQTLQTLSRITNAALTNALIAVLTSPPSSSSSSLQSHQNMPENNYHVQPNEAGTAFRRYNARSLVPGIGRTQMSSMFKRAIIFYRGLTFIQRQQQFLQSGGTIRRSTLRMISERRRREKLNDNFQVLRSFLPPGTKKDKASVLARSAEYLSSLKAQVVELAQRKHILETQLLFPQENIIEEQEGGSESVIVSILPVDYQSTSEEGRVVDLEVAVFIGQTLLFSILDLAICVIGYLKQVNNVSVMSIEANTTRVMLESTSLNSISLRLSIEGDEWDESSFQEAIRRVVADQARLSLQAGILCS